jgi:hypothetical protein
MPNDQNQELISALRWHPFPPRVGDPAVILETILQEVEANQRAHVMGLYLASISETLQANLKFVQGLHSVMGGRSQQTK